MYKKWQVPDLLSSTSSIQNLKGQMSQGLQLLEEGQRDSLENQWRPLYARSEHILGKVYSQMVAGEALASLK